MLHVTRDKWHVTCHIKDHWGTNDEYVWMSLKVTSKFNIPGITQTWNGSTWSCIQVRSSDMKNIFGLTGTFVTWDSKVTSPQKPIWLHGGANFFKLWHGFKIFPTLADLCHIQTQQADLICSPVVPTGGPSGPIFLQLWIDHPLLLLANCLDLRLQAEWNAQIILHFRGIIAS